ncbi:beta-ketoacyl synthase chain length factor [Odoribacter sp. OttesenSCG-928-J03]|nr:beta-ketoacyl synthase chain length factor [Odoribacter sp. OttesenSCG-928-J03]MDL2331239.1 beta-ketoacyl synthase chain length factor [Odoribacter sp. OttesenSCG-928-A06]
MKKAKIYIQAAEQVSVQVPLSREWMKNPILHHSMHERSIEPDYKAFLSPLEARRMGKLLKRALVTSLAVIRESGVEHPDAVITGTGLGCIENTELLLNALNEDGEQLLKPTHFMQSTHNTISSLISIQTKTHGYNVTYSHKGISFDSALMDAWNQFQLDMVHSALVGGHDEMTPSYFKLLQKIGFVGQDNELCGETAVSIMLNNEVQDGLCILSGFKLMYKPDLERLKEGLLNMLNKAGISLRDVDAVMTGMSGNKVNDDCYHAVIPELFGDTPILHYKHIFGEGYTASGMGLYAAACCLFEGEIPSFLYLDPSKVQKSGPKYIVLFNQFEGKNYSFTLLEATCGK